MKSFILKYYFILELGPMHSSNTTMLGSHTWPMGHFKVTALLSFKCLDFKTHTHDSNCCCSFKLLEPFNLYIYIFKMITHYCGKTWGICNKFNMALNHYSQNTRCLKRKEIFNFSFMNLCYDQKPLVMLKIEWVWTCNAIILIRVLIQKWQFYH